MNMRPEPKTGDVLFRSIYAGQNGIITEAWMVTVEPANGVYPALIRLRRGDASSAGITVKAYMEGQFDWHPTVAESIDGMVREIEQAVESAKRDVEWQEAKLAGALAELERRQR